VKENRVELAPENLVLISARASSGAAPRSQTADRRVGTLFRYVTNHPGLLSLLPSVGR